MPACTGAVRFTGLVDDCREATTLPSGPKRLRVTLGGWPVNVRLALRVPWPELTEKVCEEFVKLREPENVLVTASDGSAIVNRPTTSPRTNDHRTAGEPRRRV